MEVSYVCIEGMYRGKQHVDKANNPSTMCTDLIKENWKNIY